MSDLAGANGRKRKSDTSSMASPTQSQPPSRLDSDDGATGGGTVPSVARTVENVTQSLLPSIRQKPIQTGNQCKSNLSMFIVFRFAKTGENSTKRVNCESATRKRKPLNGGKKKNNHTSLFVISVFPQR